MIGTELTIKCPKCHTNKNIIASETILATTDFVVKDGIITDTNNEYGNGYKIEFSCRNCGHRWTGKKGVSIESYIEKY